MAELSKEGRAMLRLLFLGMLFIALPMPLHPGPVEDARAVLEQWAEAFNAGDDEGVLALYAPGALFFGTLSPTLATTPEELRHYFAALPRTRSVRLGEQAEIALSDTVILEAGLYEFSLTRDGQTVTIPARYSLLLVRRDDHWRIVHHHSSVRPSLPQR
jgi:uncharacterized protein (TIGR02246 family)